MFLIFVYSKSYFPIYSDPAKSNPPKSVSASLTSITIEWEEVDECCASKIYNLYGKDRDGNQFTKMNISNNRDVVEPLVQNTNYNFSVSARNDGGEGEFSESSELQTGK